MRKEFTRVTPEAVGIPSASIETLLDRLEEGWTEPHGLMIMRHGKVCAEGWWAPYAPGVRHGLQSHTKTYAATSRNFVSPPPRRTPLVRMELVERKMIMMLTASMSSKAISLVSAEIL